MSPTNPLTFIGLPDWRSAALAVLFALPWLVLLGRGWLKRAWAWAWAAVALAATLFAFSIAWAQVPIQLGLNALWLRLLGLDTIRRYVLLVAVPSIVVSGLVQETAKLLVAILALRALGAGRERSAGLAMGAAAGAGYGGFEAFWVFNTMLASGWSLAMVQLAGGAALIGFVERLFTVPFHIGAAALSGYGYAAGRPWRFLLLAIGLHSLGNYGAVLLQAGLLNVATVEVWAGLIAVATFAAALWLVASHRGLDGLAHARAAHWYPSRPLWGPTRRSCPAGPAGGAGRGRPVAQGHTIATCERRLGRKDGCGGWRRTPCPCVLYGQCGQT